MANAVPQYDLDACWLDYRLGLINSFWRDIGAQRLHAGKGERGERIRSLSVERIATAVADHDGEKFLDGLPHL